MSGIVRQSQFDRPAIPANPGEVWKDISGFEGLYSVSTHGRIWSHVSGCLKKAKTSRRDRYLSVKIYKNGQENNFLVHRLVAETFIPNPEGKPQVNHKDFDRQNPRVDNLEWNTPLENVGHFLASGRKKRCHRSHPRWHVNRVRSLYSSGDLSIEQLARAFRMSTKTVCKMINGEYVCHD
ncbi:NUMOD4 domain-containing protein [Chelativorans xinjiangense]|uniref:NUMOD4 domain-containing protein n=1 Tax=Chelativorans xinjiangense TaxID=2681485 RepID=UPI00135BDF06|nr:NUMOD4 domain-containing protein [Chelativorans xinjiangense]